MAYLHSFTPTYVLLTVDDCIVRHTPIFVTRRKQCATNAGDLVRIYSTNASNRATPPPPCAPLAEDCGMIRRIELLLSLKCRDQVSYDDTGYRPVLQGHLGGVW